MRQILRELERVNVGCVCVFSFIILWVYVQCSCTQNVYVQCTLYILYKNIVYLMYIFMCAYNIISIL